MAGRDQKVTKGSHPASATGTIGSIIRGARKKRNLTLTLVAERTDLSVSYLSQVERDRMTPSVSALKRIADVLKIPAGSLMFGSENGGSGRPIGVVRRNSRKQIIFPDSNIIYHLLTPDLRRRASALWLKAPPGSESGPTAVHEGEDCVIVLKGELSVEVGDVWYSLAEGDSIYFNSELPHRWRNGGNVVVEAIWISTPPSF